MKYVVSIIIILSCLSCGDKRGSEKGLYIENADWDFGSTDANTKLEHTFIIENPTDHKCIITSIIASCGCTNYTLEKDTLLPNDKCNLRVLLTTPSVTGYFMRDINIYSTMSEEPNLITLNGYIPVSREYIRRNYRVKLHEGIYSKSNVVYMGNLYKDKQISNKFELVNTTNTPVHIKISIKPNIKWAEIVGPTQLDPWKPELFTIICDGSNVDNEWGEKEFGIYVGDNSVKCLVTIIPMNFVNRKKSKARVFIPNTNNENVEIRNVGTEDLLILKVQSIKKSDITISDSVIHTKKSGFINIEKMVINDTVEILTNDAQNPIVRIPIN